MGAEIHRMKGSVGLLAGKTCNPLLGLLLTLNINMPPRGFHISNFFQFFEVTGSYPQMPKFEKM